MQRVQTAGWIGLAMAVVMMTACGGCGGEGAREKNQRGGTGRAETDFSPLAEAVVDSFYTPPSTQPTPEPIPVFRADYPQILDLTPQSAGGVSVTLLDTALKGSVGVMSSGMPGDYLLSNARVRFIFKAIRPRKPGEPLAVPLAFTNTRHAGSLVDVFTAESPVDFLDEFTQGLGLTPGGPVADYDSVRFVRREADSSGSGAAVGIIFTGSLPKNETEDVRIETAYWLAPESTRLEVGTKILKGESDLPITDFANFGPANLLADIHGVPPRQGIVLDTEWCAAQLGKVAMALAVAGGRLEAHFHSGSMGRFQAYLPEGETRKTSELRTILVGTGNFSKVTDQIFTELNPGRPFGVFRGQVVDREYLQPAPGSWVDVFHYNRDDPRAVQNRKTFTRIGVAQDGTFECKLPILDTQAQESRFFIGTGARSRQFGLSERSLVVTPGSVDERQMQVGRPAILTVRVVDSVTSEPLAARIRFEALPGTPPADFDGIESVSGYANSFYVPPQGASIELNQGFYELTASHGISYNMAKTDVETAWGFETEAVIALEGVSPTPGWLALELGVMTHATPGCTLTPEEAVLMCAGEDLEWLVSGDLEVITDLQPAIQALGLEHKMKSSRGFRTYLPKRPKWGEFIVYNLPAEAPDPRVVRDQWHDLTDSVEFMATLRRLYPGAMIHVCFPWLYAAGVHPETAGYFHLKDWSVHMMAFEDFRRPEKLEMNVDSLSMFHRRGNWHFQWEKDFYFINALRSRFVIPIPACETRVPFLSEPGYPRTLVFTDTIGPARVDEALIMGAMKQGRWQVTSGPFIDFRADGRKEGDVYQPSENKAFVRFTITAPDWAPTTDVSLNLDGLMLWKDADNSGKEPEPMRYTYQGETKFSPQYKENKDTLLDVETNSEGVLDALIPRRVGTSIKAFAFNGPVIIDTNGNGVWDPPHYRDKGK